MPFSLSNAPASFQNYINKIFAEKLDILFIIYLDNILVYTKDRGQLHIDAVCWILKQFRKHGLYANLKNCHFYQDEVRFLCFVIWAQSIKMEEEKIETVKAWAKPTSVKYIQVFLSFANFYQRFIQGFSKIASLLTSTLKTISSPANFETPLKTTWYPTFLTPEAKLAFIQLREVFSKASILHHFDPECYIRIKTDTSWYVICGILNQLTLESGQWHLVAFFSRKMILAET